MISEADRATLQPGALFCHYKNKPYRVVGIARHSESLEELVIYEALYENQLGTLWARPIEMFLGYVESAGQRVRRFTPVSE